MNILAEKLSPRELLVMKGWCDGLTNLELTSAMHISEKTLGTYRGRVLKKLQATNPRHATYLWGLAERTAPDEKQLDAIVTMIARMAGKVALKRVLPQ